MLAAAARIAEPFRAGFAQVAGVKKSNLQRLAHLSFLRAGADGWRFAHALAGQYARELELPQGLLEKLGRRAVAGIASADANAAWQRDLSYSCYIIASKIQIPQEHWADALA